MKSIKSKILLPFVLTLTITPLITLMVFNIYFRSYIDNGVVKQLQNTVKTTKVLIKSELSQTIYETDQDKITKSITNLNKILRTSKIALNTELLLFKETGEMIYPTSYENTFLNQTLIGNIRDKLTNIDSNEVIHIGLEGQRYSITGYRLTEIPIKNIPYIVFISSMDESDPVFMTINVVLLSVMLFGILIGILVSFRIAKSVETPLKELCYVANMIGEREKFELHQKTNISEINQLSDSIIKMGDKIEIYDNAQKAFLQNSSHELKTPLMSIQGYAEGIENAIFPDPKMAGTVIKEESQKLDRLISQLLMLSRIDNQNYLESLEKHNLNDVIKDYRQRCEGLALKSKKFIIFNDSSDNLIIWYNESLFTQCFMNVVSNAIRYAKETITIDVFKENETAIIYVTDDGVGISQEDISHVFDRFYKGQNGQSGLGLAIAKASIIAMKGAINAQNTDSGARFVLTFPIAT